MLENHEDFMHIDSKEIANFIFAKLLAEGIVMKREDIELILELEAEYMEEKGITTIVYGEIDED